MTDVFEFPGNKVKCSTCGKAISPRNTSGDGLYFCNYDHAVIYYKQYDPTKVLNTKGGENG